MRIKDIDKGYASFAETIRKMKNRKVDIGLFKESGKNEGEYIADYAYANEFGTQKIPSRPFMRTTFDENEKSWGDYLDKNLDKAIAGKIDADTALALLAEKAVDDIKKTISSNLPPPNAEATIKKKGSSKTLIDSGTMRNSINYRIN